jgi:hypothetical protein
MSNTDTDPSVRPPDSVPPYLNGFTSPFSPGGYDLASVARQTHGRLPPTNAASGTRMTLADIAAQAGQREDAHDRQRAVAGGFPETQDSLEARDEEAQRIGPQYPVPQNYIPATAADAGKYGYGNLPTGVTPGDDGWSTNTPTTMQSYRVAQNSSQALGLWGSPGAAPYASAAAGLASPLVFLLNALSRGGFTHNFDAARLGVLKAQQQQFYNNLEMANYNERASLQNYGEIIITGKDEASTIQALRNAALAHPGGPDQAMLAALDNGGLARARQFARNCQRQALRVVAKRRPALTARPRSPWDSTELQGHGLAAGGWSRCGQGRRHFSAHEGGKLLEHFAPEGSNQWLEENIPGVRSFDQWAERQYKEPYRGPAERAGSYLIQGAATLLGPSKFVKGGKIAQAAETAARGAFGGALANPDDPVRGAASGAPAGFAGPLAQRAMQSPMGRFIGGHLPEATLAGVAYQVLRHVPGGHAILAGLIWPSIHWYRSPFGRKFRQWGEHVIDEAGNILGRVNPEASGYAAGKADQTVRPQPTTPWR